MSLYQIDPDLNYFNSEMVQFQNGAIKSFARLVHRLRRCAFQFQNGAIKRTKTPQLLRIY